MRDIVLDLLRRQQSAGFPDLAGAEVGVIIPVSDRLISEFVALTLPKQGAVRDVEIRAEAANRLRVTLRLSMSRFLPAMSLTAEIDEQPDLPASPVLGLRLLGLPKLLTRTGAVTRFLDSLPPGITLEGERVRVDVAILLGRSGHAEVLRYVTALTVTTREGAVVITASGRVT